MRDSETIYGRLKKKVIEFIEMHDFISLNEVRKVYRFSEAEKEFVERLFSDKDVSDAMDVRNLCMVEDIRRTLKSKTREGDIKAAKMLYSLVADEEGLARINGGGVKLIDVRSIGTSRGKIIIQQANVQDAQILEDAERKHILIGNGEGQV